MINYSIKIYSIITFEEGDKFKINFLVINQTYCPTLPQLQKAQSLGSAATTANHRFVTRYIWNGLQSKNSLLNRNHIQKRSSIEKRRFFPLIETVSEPLILVFITNKLLINSFSWYRKNNLLNYDSISSNSLYRFSETCTCTRGSRWIRRKLIVA